MARLFSFQAMAGEALLLKLNKPNQTLTYLCEHMSDHE
jgi:hypothetical protein